MSNQPLLYGYNKRCYVERETTFGTYEAVAATDLIEWATFSVDFQDGRKYLDVATPSRQYNKRISGMKTVGWNGSTIFRVGESAGGMEGTPYHRYLQHVFGAAQTDNAGPTRDTYSLSSDVTGPGSLTQLLEWEDLLSYQLLGSWVETLRLSLGGPNELMFDVSGGAKQLIHTSYCADPGTQSTGTTLTVDTAYKYALEIGSIIEIDGTAYTVTAGPTANGSYWDFTISGTPAGWSSGEVVTPWSPGVADDAIDAMVPIVGNNGACTLNVGDGQGAASIAAYVRDFEVTINTGHTGQVNKALNARVPGIYVGRRTIEGKLTIDLPRAALYLLNARRDRDASSTLVVSVGDTSSRYVKVTMNNVDFDLEAPSSSPNDEVTVGLPFTCLDSDTLNDAIQLDVY